MNVVNIIKMYLIYLLTILLLYYFVTFWKIKFLILIFLFNKIDNIIKTFSAHKYIYIIYRYTPQQNKVVYISIISDNEEVLSDIVNYVYIIIYILPNTCHS